MELKSFLFKFGLSFVKKYFYKCVNKELSRYKYYCITFNESNNLCDYNFNGMKFVDRLELIEFKVDLSFRIVYNDNTYNHFDVTSHNIDYKFYLIIMNKLFKNYLINIIYDRLIGNIINSSDQKIKDDILSIYVYGEVKDSIISEIKKIK